MADIVAGDPASQEPQARHVIYCGVCSLPPEYCEFGGTVKKCEDWLKNTHPELHERLYSEETLSANLATLSVEAQKRAEKDASKKAAAAEKHEEQERKRKESSTVIIKRIERNKRKFVTAIQGLEAFGLDNKKIAKELGKKFATGSSVTKLPGGLGEEIVVQGDVSDDVQEWIEEHHGDKVPEKNIELVEDKKKKSSN